MINIKELSQIDFKSIDLSFIQDRFSQSKEIIINAVIVLATLIGTIMIVSDRSTEVQSISKAISTLEKKEFAINDYEKAKAELDSFIDSMPEGTTELDNVIQLVNELAILRDIQILSFTPKEEQKEKYYDLALLELSISTTDYSNMGLFIKDIEESEFNLRIERWAIDMDSQSSRRKSRRYQVEDEADLEQQTMRVSMEIASIKIKND